MARKLGLGGVANTNGARDFSGRVREAAPSTTVTTSARRVAPQGGPHGGKMTHGRNVTE